MMATEKAGKKNKKVDDLSLMRARISFMEKEREFLAKTNSQQSQVIDTFMNATCALMEEKIFSAEKFIDHLKMNITTFKSQQSLIYQFMKSKGFDMHDIFEFINDKRIEYSGDKKALKRLDRLEKSFKIQWATAIDENEEESDED